MLTMTIGVGLPLFLTEMKALTGFFAQGGFESAPTNVQPNLATSTANSNDSSTSWKAPSSSQLSNGLSTMSASSQGQKSRPAIQRAQSPNSWSQPSQLCNTKSPQLDTIGWGANPLETGEGSPTSSPIVLSPAAMTKEEKALEMTRRKEERKQVCLKQASREKFQ
jgi:hypothetical protein